MINRYLKGIPEDETWSERKLWACALKLELDYGLKTQGILAEKMTEKLAEGDIPALDSLRAIAERLEALQSCTGVH